MAHDFSKTWGEWYPQHPDAMFRERNGRIVPYLSSKNLSFKNMDPVSEVPKLPIRSIRVGPASDQPLIARGVRRLLDTYGHSDVEIAQTVMPFRTR